MTAPPGFGMYISRPFVVLWCEILFFTSYHSASVHPPIKSPCCALTSVKPGPDVHSAAETVGRGVGTPLEVTPLQLAIPTQNRNPVGTNGRFSRNLPEQGFTSGWKMAHANRSSNMATIAAGNFHVANGG